MCLYNVYKYLHKQLWLFLRYVCVINTSKYIL